MIWCDSLMVNIRSVAIPMTYLRIVSCVVVILIMELVFAAVWNMHQCLHGITSAFGRVKSQIVPNASIPISGEMNVTHSIIGNSSTVLLYYRGNIHSIYVGCVFKLPWVADTENANMTTKWKIVWFNGNFTGWFCVHHILLHVMVQHQAVMFDDGRVYR